MTWPVLVEAMRANLHGLGLRETAGEGCLHCHVGAMGTPMTTWDFASDAKPTKRTARLMMRMVRDINGSYLADIEGRDTAGLDVTCYTCHTGRISPKPLLGVLEDTLAAEGVEGLARTYNSLRDAYYGRGVYDFHGALIDLGVTLADRGDYDDAIRVLQLHISVEPDSPDAHRWLIRLMVERATPSAGIDDLLALYDSLTATERPEGAVVWYTMRAVGVRLRRRGEVAAAAKVFAANERRYPADPRVVTDLAQTRLALGDTTAAVTGARRALDLDPAYENARDLLQELGDEP